MSRIALGLAALLAILALPAQAADVMAGHLKLSAPWARATPKGAAVGGGYLTITNTGNTPDRLVSGSTAISKKVEIHEMSMDNGVMKMRMLANGLEIKPGQSVTLKPGSYHIMFMGLKHQIKEGEHFKATLVFAKAGKVELDFAVKGLGAMNSGNDDHGSMKMPMKQ